MEDTIAAVRRFYTGPVGALARLRRLCVEPFARRRGVGDALIETCIGFARQSGYARLTLRTHAVLEAARRIDARDRFARVETAPRTAVGTPVAGETWNTGPARFPGDGAPGSVRPDVA